MRGSPAYSKNPNLTSAFKFDVDKFNSVTYLDGLDISV
jgi:hypothetical protein